MVCVIWDFCVLLPVNLLIVFVSPLFLLFFPWLGLDIKNCIHPFILRNDELGVTDPSHACRHNAARQDSPPKDTFVCDWATPAAFIDAGLLNGVFSVLPKVEVMGFCFVVPSVFLVTHSHAHICTHTHMQDKCCDINRSVRVTQ